MKISVFYIYLSVEWVLPLRRMNHELDGYPTSMDRSRSSGKCKGTMGKWHCLATHSDTHTHQDKTGYTCITLLYRCCIY